jgi:hypothetical protein
MDKNLLNILGVKEEKRERGGIYYIGILELSQCSLSGLQQEGACGGGRIAGVVQILWSVGHVDLKLHL